jgi:hypothetical protein
MKTVLLGVIIGSVVLFFWSTIVGIDRMVLRDNNNKFHAMILGCTYLGPVRDLENVLYFECKDNIEFHKEIDWTVK